VSVLIYIPFLLWDWLHAGDRLSGGKQKSHWDFPSGLFRDLRREIC